MFSTTTILNHPTIAGITRLTRVFPVVSTTLYNMKMDSQF